MTDLNTEAKNMILRLALAKHTPRQIAERMGIPEAVVRRYYPLPRKPGFQKGNKTNSPWRSNAPKRNPNT